MNSDVILYAVVMTPVYLIGGYFLWKNYESYRKRSGRHSPDIAVVSFMGMLLVGAMYVSFGLRIAQTTETEAVYEFVIDGYTTGSKSKTYAILKEVRTGLTVKVRSACTSGLSVGDVLQLPGMIRQYKNEHTINITRTTC